MSIDIQAAIYARVSSEQQAAANTIASQLAALRERLAKEGLPSHSELEFIDEGYSGALCRSDAERVLRFWAWSDRQLKFGFQIGSLISQFFKTQIRRFRWEVRRVNGWISRQCWFLFRSNYYWLAHLIT